ncbi:FtsK/SpoIIIE domain-containing protein [Nostoc sp.]|uniref:FtsK/SpoIIIE domain-containing protein n=1 Tax=Nostoc sp. TaxID=1180 RepID=UPI002FF51585
MANIIAIIKEIKLINTKIQQDREQVAKLGQSNPQHQQKLKQTFLEEKERSNKHINQEENRLKEIILKEKERLNQRLEELKEQVMVEFKTIASYTNFARQKAHDEAPRLLKDEWMNQQELLADMMNRIDGLIAPSGDRPPRLISLPWSDPRWTPSEKAKNNYRPQISGQAPGVLRVGELHQVNALRVEELEPSVGVPAFVPIRALSNNVNQRLPGHIAIFSNNAESRQAAVEAIQSIALRIISTFPAKKMKGIFIDPVSMGNNFPFKELHDFISGLKTYTRSDDVREQLRHLSVHIEQVIQNYLGRNYQSIEEFNQAKSSVEEAYRYLFVADFPTNFDNNSWEDIKSLLVNGSKAGVYVVLHIDEKLEKPRNFDYEVFNSYCTVLKPSEDKYQDKPLFTTQLPNGLFSKIRLDSPPPNEQFNKLIATITQTTKNVKTETVPFTELYPEKPAWSEAYDSRQEIRAPIGVMGAMDRLEFWLGENEDGQNVSQALLAGRPGAGKSYTLHATIISLAMRYAPDELEMYLLDFKEGVEFQIYVDPERSENSSHSEGLNEAKALPHAKVISIESDREFGLSVLKSVQEEIEKRGSKFKAAGVSSLKDYRSKSNEKLPRVLVVIDEFQYMFQENDNITRQFNLIFEDITRRGRAFGVHLLIASQSPNVPNMNRSIYSFIELRMAQQMDKNTAASVLAEGNSDAVDLLDRPGKVIYNRDFGRKSYNDIGQVADMSSGARQKALLHIQSIAAQRNYQRPEPLILFNGTQATKLSHNRQLVKLSEMSHWLSLRDLNKEVIKEHDWSVAETPGVTWLGEAMRIGDHTKAIFLRRSRSNMLIVSASEETVFGILGGILISLVHCYESQKAQFRIIDLSQEDEDNSWAEMSTTFRDAFETYFPTCVGKRFPNLENKVLRAEDILQQTHAEFARRKKQRDENPDSTNFGQSLFFLYALGSLNRAQNLRPVIGRRGEEPSAEAEKLLELLSQGPELGIHTILWLDNMKTFMKITGDNRSWLTHFDLRVGSTMPADDSRLLLGETYAQSLPQLRAYFRDEATAIGLEKFKPYAVTSSQEIAEYSKRLKQRSSQRD